MENPMIRITLLLTVVVLTGCVTTQTTEQRRTDAISDLSNTRIQFTDICSKLPGEKTRANCDKQNRKTFAAFGYHVGSAPDRERLERVISVIDRCTERENRALTEIRPDSPRRFLASINGCVNTTLASRERPPSS
jgi:hypothetical protein